jgi:hypothetical protein
MVLPQRYFLTKEISVKGSFAYNDKDFKETVKAFTEGEYAKEIQDEFISGHANLCIEIPQVSSRELKRWSRKGSYSRISRPKDLKSLSQIKMSISRFSSHQNGRT